jgi:hypothetical protein
VSLFWKKMTVFISKASNFQNANTSRPAINGDLTCNICP